MGVSSDAARMLKSRYNKANNPGSSTPQKAKAAAEDWKKANPALIDEYHLHVEPKRERAERQPVTQPKQKRVKLPDAATLRNFAIAGLLVSVIVGHSALVWYDCGQMWGIPGVIGGGVTFLIVLAALLLASDETKPRTSDTALWFVFFIDIAAWFVHYPTFKKYADIGNIETGMFAGFLCACSFAALYIFRDSKLD